MDFLRPHEATSYGNSKLWWMEKNRNTADSSSEKRTYNVRNAGLHMLGHGVRNQVMIIILCISDISHTKTIQFWVQTNIHRPASTEQTPETPPKKHSTVLTFLFCCSSKTSALF